MHSNTTRNPFPYDRSAARQAFFQTLAAVQQQRCQPDSALDELLSEIERMQVDAQQDLNEQWDDLRTLAQNGLLERVQVNLNHFMKDYACHVARRQFFRSDIDPWCLNKQTPGADEALARKLDAKHDQLSSLLLCDLQRAAQQQEADQLQAVQGLVKKNIASAEKIIQRQQQEIADLRKLLEDLTGKMEAQATSTPQVVREAHADARASLEEAIKATQQTRDYVPLVMQPVIGLLQHQQQALPRAIEQGIAKVNRQKSASQLTIFVLAVLGFFALCGCSFVALLHLY